MRTIAVEEHFATPAFVQGPGKQFFERFKNMGPRGAQIAERLFETGDKRVAEMDAAGVDMQILSLNSPGVEQAEPAEAVACARDANDFLADTVRQHAARFAGLASLPIQAPEEAAKELERCVRRLGFKGTNINGHTRGHYLDDPFFAPVLDCAVALDVPIYLHPTVPHKPVADALYGGFAPSVSGVLASSGWGWHIETAIHLLRMILGGVFDRHPKLQIVIGHMGEAIPFMLPRLNRNLSPQLTELSRPFSDYLRQNVHYTFGGFNFTPTFLNLLLEIGVDRIMFSVDYPYGSMEEAMSFLRHLPVNELDRERIAHGNAENLFKL
ncbi:MAG: 2-amino-3-carboxymuconate-6-semialdehyde decarboxylase [Pseudolabrys sp.]|jgi:predicted TIM-barrel fold metal-dependent hydrolase|nr:2-amino-3-carboxymuconate-6-semialdehyde decarboxylase [Pseudolabrys sp.]